MYKVSRLILLVSVGLYFYCLVLLIMVSYTKNPAWAGVLVIVGFAALARIQKKIGLTLSAHGTAVWAGEDQLHRARMIDARRGLILGRLLGSAKVGLMGGIKGLLDARLKAKDACRRFFSALQRRQPAPLVRLPQAMTLYGIRVVGKPGGSYASCAELSAYG